MSILGLVFRTANALLWGGGQGSDLAPATVDMNFWLLANAITDLQNTSSGAGIDYMVMNGNILSVHLTNHEVLQFAVPTAQWSFKHQWTPYTSYNVMDVITNDGATYVVTFPVPPTFATFGAAPDGTPTQTDGNGNYYYAFLLAAPADEIPDTGEPGQVLQWPLDGSPGGVTWAYINRSIGIYVEQPADADETLVQYVFAESVQFPANLPGSQGYAGVPAAAAQTWEILKNNASIGDISFPEGPGTVTFTFPVETTFVAGDVLTIIAPPSPVDPDLALVSITLLGQVVLP